MTGHEYCDTWCDNNNGVMMMTEMGGYDCVWENIPRHPDAPALVE